MYCQSVSLKSERERFYNFFLRPAKQLATCAVRALLFKPTVLEEFWRSPGRGVLGVPGSILGRSGGCLGVGLLWGSGRGPGGSWLRHGRSWRFPGCLLGCPRMSGDALGTVVVFLVLSCFRMFRPSWCFVFLGGPYFWLFRVS